MNIYVTHSRAFDYGTELYVPIRKSVLNNKHNFYLPHEDNREVNPKEIILNSDLVIAEISHPSTGSGVEIGWAEISKIPVLCIYKEDASISRSIKFVTDNLLSYKNSDDMLIKLDGFLSKF